MGQSKFEQSGFLSQNSIKPSNMLPPCSLSPRENAEKLEKSLKLPMSPAFISIYKMSKEISVPRAHDFCREKNIPFNSEENNFYRMKQSEKRFKNYSQTINKCFETARPSEMATASSVLTQKGKNIPPKDKLTKEFLDQRFYVANVFENAH